VQSRTYEITFAGQAGAALRAEFDDCEVSVGPGTTTLRAELPDQGALQGLLQRIGGLALELIDVRLVAPPPAGWPINTITPIGDRRAAASEASVPRPIVSGSPILSSLA
jgi:hypothetical protein